MSKVFYCVKSEETGPDQNDEYEEKGHIGDQKGDFARFIFFVAF